MTPELFESLKEALSSIFASEVEEGRCHPELLRIFLPNYEELLEQCFGEGLLKQCFIGGLLSLDGLPKPTEGDIVDQWNVSNKAGQAWVPSDLEAGVAELLRELFTTFLFNRMIHDTSKGEYLGRTCEGALEGFV